jgi:hypothetical protein
LIELRASLAVDCESWFFLTLARTDLSAQNYVAKSFVEKANHYRDSRATEAACFSASAFLGVEPGQIVREVYRASPWMDAILICLTASTTGRRLHSALLAALCLW